MILIWAIVIFAGMIAALVWIGGGFGR